jgi:hypothetical protein
MRDDNPLFLQGKFPRTALRNAGKGPCRYQVAVKPFSRTGTAGEGGPSPQGLVGEGTVAERS